MGTIKDKVAIIGMGCTKFGELWDKSVEDLIIDATYEAIEDAGIEPKDIQAAWLGTVFSANPSLLNQFSGHLAWVMPSRFPHRICYPPRRLHSNLPQRLTQPRVSRFTGALSRHITLHP